MSQDLHQVLRDVLINGVIAYLKGYADLQQYVSRIEQRTDTDQIKLVSHSSVHGEAWKIVVSEADTPTKDILIIPLNPMRRKTFYLLILWREVTKMSEDDLLRVSPDALRVGTQNMRDTFWSDADMWQVRDFSVRVVEELRGGMSDHEWYLERLKYLLEYYIEEFLA